MHRRKIAIFIIANTILLAVLYVIPIEKAKGFCIFKMITGKECWNCGMTRAFLSVLHFQIENAIDYNWKVIVVFPMTIAIYLFSWHKYLMKK